MKSLKLISIMFLMLVLLPVPVSAFWNVEVSTNGDLIQITYCAGNENGYYKLKSATNTILRSEYIGANICRSYNEQKSYLYSLEHGNWIFYVTDSSGTVQAFRTVNVNPTATPTASPTPHPTYTVSPTPYPTYNPYPVPTVTYQPYPQPTVTPIKPKIIPKPIADYIGIKETPGFGFSLAVIGIIAVIVIRRKL